MTVEGVARYKVVESIKGLIPKKDLLSSLDLTLLDFFPVAVLEEHSTTDSSDLRLSVVLSYKVLGKYLKET